MLNLGKQAVDRDRQRVERFLHVRAVDEDLRHGGRELVVDLDHEATAG